MLVDVVQLPRDLTPAHIAGRTVVVFDVLRATTTVTAALSVGVKEILIAPSVTAATELAAAHGSNAITCGETNCLPPAGFTMGNSPRGFVPAYEGRTVFMATTNGTKAIIATAGAENVFAGALVNAAAVAREASQAGLDVTLLCAGTNGRMAMEDMIGAGAVLDAIAELGPVKHGSDVAIIAHELFRFARNDLKGVLSRSAGGQNVIRNGLADDIDFCAKLNSLTAVGRVTENPLRVRRA